MTEPRLNPGKRTRALLLPWLILVALLGNLLTPLLAQAFTGGQAVNGVVLVAVCTPSGVRLTALDTQSDNPGEPTAPARPSHEQNAGHCNACLGQPVPGAPQLASYQPPASLLPGDVMATPLHSGRIVSHYAPAGMPRAPPAVRAH